MRDRETMTAGEDEEVELQFSGDAETERKKTDLQTDTWMTVCRAVEKFCAYLNWVHDGAQESTD